MLTFINIRMKETNADILCIQGKMCEIKENLKEKNLGFDLPF